MSGFITVASAPGQGATFTCELPFVLNLPPQERPAVSGHCLILHPGAQIRETLADFCLDLGLTVEARATIDPFPDELFDAVLVAGEWYIDVTARLGATCSRILNIDERKPASLLFPLSRARLRTALALAESPAAPAPERQADPALRSRVLVVEDNLTNQRVIGLLLGKMGCSVVLAGDGAQAVQLCRHQRFDVVFMDMQMPVMDGLEATRLLRQLPGANARVPIIALTANALEEDRQRCIDAGMSGFLAKPIVRDQLLAALRGSLPAASADSMRSA